MIISKSTKSSLTQMDRHGKEVILEDEELVTIKLLDMDPKGHSRCFKSKR